MRYNDPVFRKVLEGSSRFSGFRNLLAGSWTGFFTFICLFLFCFPLFHLFQFSLASFFVFFIFLWFLFSFLFFHFFISISLFLFLQCSEIQKKVITSNICLLLTQEMFQKFTYRMSYFQMFVFFENHKMFPLSKFVKMFMFWNFVY